MKKIFLSFLSIIVFSACTLQTKHRGYIFPDDLESQISDVKTTDDLEKKLGSPQARTVLGDPVWIYYGVDEDYHGPFPITYDNKKALLAWSKDGKITKTKILNDVDFDKDLKIDKDETPIPAAVELNAIQELVNNIGRFTPSGIAQ